MRAFAPLVFAFLATLCLVQLPAETARMPLAEVKTGMTGIGVTVFSGAEREEFNVEVLGVLTNVMGPQRNIIIARLTGGPLATTGVIQGMSGSPVYFNGRLAGAVSYSLGSFSTDTIAGITPIEEMVATDTATTATGRRTPRRIRIPVAEQDLATVAQEAFGSARPFAQQPTDVRAFGLPSSEAGRLATLLQPIATPLVLNGFAPELQTLWVSMFGAGGLSTTVGGTMTAEAQLEVVGQPLQPGDTVGVSLVQGDLTMAGTGTVTMVEDDRVYAFGHPFYNLGTVRFPMTRAHVTTLLPSLALSSKIAAIGQVLGTIDQDRSTGIYGSLGPGPKMIPIRMTLDDPERNIQKIFRFDIIEDPIFSPLLAYSTALSTFVTWTRDLGPKTYEVTSTTRLRDRDNVTSNDIYTGNGASTGAASAVANPVAALSANDFEPVEIMGIDVAVTAVEERRTATLERVWLETIRPQAGDEIPLMVLSRNDRGAELLETVMIQIPNHASGNLVIEVSDAATLSVREQQEGRSPAEAESVDQLIRNLNDVRRNNRLYIKLLRTESGAVDRGEPLPSLPGSVLAVLEGNRSNGGLGLLREATLGEWELVGDHAVSGSRRLFIKIER
jgi:hypothetical protein